MTQLPMGNTRGHQTAHQVKAADWNRHRDGLCQRKGKAASNQIERNTDVWLARFIVIRCILLKLHFQIMLKPLRCQWEKILTSKAISKTIRAITVGQIRSQKITNDTLESGVRIWKIASHLLHRTFLRRPALRNKTARMPPAKNTSQLNEPLNSTVGL